MEREVYKKLIEWKNKSTRKPLILEGARQVGKTYILQAFGRNEYDNMIYINCHNNSFMKELFSIDFDMDRILLGLSAYAEQRITVGKTLIFLDEIQEIPNGLASLKYFCENAREQHVVVAGSLLGISNIEQESYPVGKVDTLKLYPMSFAEFLDAMGKKELLDIIQSLDWPLIQTLDEKLKDLLRQYYFVGGMPEAVSYYVETKDIISIRQIQKEILNAYSRDFAKHAGNETQRIRQVWESVPAQLARENKKFIFGAIKKGARANDFEKAIQWLIEAGLVYKVERNTEPRIPLKFYADKEAFKMYLLDVGLFGAMAETPPREMLIGDNVFSEFKDAFTENYVLEQMVTIEDLPIYYYSKDNSSQELDFIIQTNNKVTPVEVKAEENVKAKSLSTYINYDQKQYNLKGVRFSMKPFIDQGWMENVPLYAVKSYIRSLLTVMS